jgi:hypothetical protein
MSTTGTTLIGGVNEIIVGQPFGASVTSAVPANPANPDTYAWTQPAPGGACAPFQNYQASVSGATVTQFTDPTASTLSCYFSAAGSVTPTCTYYCGAAMTNITLTYSAISVFAPALAQNHSGCGTMQLLYYVPPQIPIPNSTNPTDFRLWGDSYTVGGISQLGGTLYAGYLSDPPGFGNETGQFGYVQIYQDLTKQAPPWTLDGAFPYPTVGGWFPSPSTNTVNRVWVDLPGISQLAGLTGPIGPLIYDYSFKLYIFYLPPGSGACYIPFKCIPWIANGQCTLSSSSTWTQSDSGSGLSATITPVPPSAFPTWIPPTH